MSHRSHVLFQLGLLVGGALLGGAARAAAPSDAAPAAGAPATPSTGVDAPATPPEPQAAPTPAAPPAAPDPALAALKQQLDELKRDLESQKAALEANTGDIETSAKENVLRIYGWADMGIGKAWFQPHDPINGFQPPTNWNFAVGNINLYFDFQPTESWSSLV